MDFNALGDAIGCAAVIGLIVVVALIAGAFALGAILL
jgi:hypothetical protein